MKLELTERMNLCRIHAKYPIALLQLLTSLMVLGTATTTPPPPPYCINTHKGPTDQTVLSVPCM